MRIEEVGEGASVRIFLGVGIRLRRQQFQHIAQDGQSVVAIKHTCPEANLPSQAPTCRLITTILKRLLGCSKEFVVGIWTNLVGREQSIEVRDMTMLELTSISIDEPFEQLFATAYLHRRQLSQCIFEGLLISNILAQNLSSLQRA